MFFLRWLLFQSVSFSVGFSIGCFLDQLSPDAISSTIARISARNGVARFASWHSFLWVHFSPIASLDLPFLSLLSGFSSHGFSPCDFLRVTFFSSFASCDFLLVISFVWFSSCDLLLLIYFHKALGVWPKILLMNAENRSFHPKMSASHSMALLQKFWICTKWTKVQTTELFELLEKFSSYQLLDIDLFSRNSAWNSSLTECLSMTLNFKLLEIQTEENSNWRNLNFETQTEENSNWRKLYGNSVETQWRLNGNWMKIWWKLDESSMPLWSIGQFDWNGSYSMHSMERHFGSFGDTQDRRDIKGYRNFLLGNHF